MKKNEITVGAEYAERRGTYGSMSRVKVIGTAPIRQGYGYNAKTVQGWAVQYLSPKTGEPLTRPGTEDQPWTANVPSRQIQQVWTEYAAEQRAKRAAQRSAANTLADNRQARARVLLDLIPLLRGAGFEDEEHEFWATNADVQAAMRVHLEDCFTKRPSRYNEEELSDIFTAPKAREMVEYVANGASLKISAPFLVRLLAVGHIR